MGHHAILRRTLRAAFSCGPGTYGGIVRPWANPGHKSKKGVQWVNHKIGPRWQKPQEFETETVRNKVEKTQKRWRRNLGFIQRLV